MYDNWCAKGDQIFQALITCLMTAYRHKFKLFYKYTPVKSISRSQILLCIIVDGSAFLAK